MSSSIPTALSSVLMACLLATSAQAAPRYTVTVLNPGGVNVAWPYGINDGGQAVGEVTSTDPHRAFLYENGRPMRDLGSLSPNRDSGASAINAHGQIAGYSEDAAGGAHAVLFAGDGSIEDLGMLGGSTYAYGINDLGQVVGQGVTPGGHVEHAFLYTPQQGMQDLGALGGGTSTATAINNAGTVVGYADYPNPHGAIHAFRYTAAGGMRDLGTLGGQHSYAYGINAAGQVVGYSEFNPTSIDRRAVLWKSDGSVTDLGASVPWSEARAINDAGLVVGSADVGASDYHAVLWDGSVMYDLNDLVDLPSGWYMVVAHDINSSGQIVANGISPGYPYASAFLLTPGPDPATLMLLSAGLLGLLSGRRRSGRV